MPQQNWASTLQSFSILSDNKMEKIMNPQVYNVSSPALKDDYPSSIFNDKQFELTSQNKESWRLILLWHQKKEKRIRIEQSDSDLTLQVLFHILCSLLNSAFLT